MDLRDRKTFGFIQCVGCGHLLRDHVKRIYAQYKDTVKRIAVINNRRSPKVCYECSAAGCGCENFKSPSRKKGEK